MGGAGLGAARKAVAEPEAAPVVRCEALRLLASHGKPADAKAAAPLLADADAGVRQAAAEVVAQLAGKESAALLTAQTVADGPALAAVTRAALAQGKGGELLAADASRALVLPAVLGERRVDELSALARTIGKGHARLTAIAGLGRVGGEPARQALQAILDAGTGKSGEPEEIRKATFRALRRLQRGEARRKAFDAEAATTTP